MTFCFDWRSGWKIEDPYRLDMGFVRTEEGIVDENPIE